ncbi:uncharacterized protein TNCV_3719881 [Trichonephila clavipes]|nr:uncharacterized protein TNCV_3719881 [Trichonephila clavipes]
MGRLNVLKVSGIKGGSKIILDFDRKSLAIQDSQVEDIKVDDEDLRVDLSETKLNVVANVLDNNTVESIIGEKVNCAIIRNLILSSRDQLIEERRTDPELGHIYRYLENPEDSSVNAAVCPYPVSRVRRNRYVLVITDHFSKWAEIIPLKKASARVIADNCFGRKLITPFQKLVMVSDETEFAVGDIERLFEEARRNTKTKHEKWEKYYHRRRRDVQIKVNDWVLVATHPLSSVTRKVVAKFKPKFEGSYNVLDVKNNRHGKREIV